MPDPRPPASQPLTEILLPARPDPATELVPGRVAPGAPVTAADRQAMLPAHLREILEDRVGHVGRGDVSRLLESWLRRRQKSMRSYQTSVTAFADWLGSSRGRQLDPAEAMMVLFACVPAQANDLVEQWVEHLGSKGNAPGTVQARLSAIRGLVKFARKAGHIDWNLEVDGPESEDYRDMSGPDPDAIRYLIQLVNERRGTAAGARDWCILTLLLFQALRRFEIADRKIREVEFAHSRMWVLGKKRTEPEAVELAPQTIDAIRSWLPFHVDARPDAWLVHAMGPHRKAGRLTDDGIHHIFQAHYAPLVQARMKAELGRTDPVIFRPHGFRHASITQLVVRGEGIETIRRFARHKSLAVTQKYIDRIPGSLRECATAVAEAYGV